jgi:hypothetical protein
MLELQLTGFGNLRGLSVAPIVAYADDVTVLVTHDKDFEVVRRALHLYGRASGALLNPDKSKGLAIAGWAVAPISLGIGLHPEVKILGVTFGTTMKGAVAASWGTAVRAVRGVAHRSYHRTLCLAQRIQYVQLCLLAKIWYLAQILPPTSTHVKQLAAVAAWFIWHGAPFRVPLSTLQQGKSDGGWNMDEISVKCKVLLYSRLVRAKTREGASTIPLLRRWKIDGRLANPPNAHVVPRDLPHLYSYAVDMAYVSPPQPMESAKIFKQRLTKALRLLDGNTIVRPTMRIVRHHPTIPWANVWKNLHTLGLADDIKSVWYAVINDIVPTHVRLAAINRMPSAACQACGEEDTLRHRLVLCNEGPVLWNWIRARMAAILRIDKVWIPDDWTFAPSYHLWPPKRNNAITWMLSHFVFFRMHMQRRQSLIDFLDFLRRARWKVYHYTRRRCDVGRYLDVL